MRRLDEDRLHAGRKHLGLAGEVIQEGRPAPSFRHRNVDDSHCADLRPGEVDRGAGHNWTFGRPPPPRPGSGSKYGCLARSPGTRRFYLIGGTGWAGGTQTTPDVISFSPLASPWDVAGVEGAVSATTDTGHTVSNGDFLMNPRWNSEHRRMVRFLGARHSLK